MMDENIKQAKDGMVTISIEDYKHYRKRDAELEELEAVGVDNWSGYSEVEWDEMYKGFEELGWV